MVPEDWSLLARSIEDGRNVCYVAREKHDVVDRLTVWKLVEYPNAWYSEGQWISKGVYRRFPEKKGVKLSDSRIDQTLLSFAVKS